MSAAIERAPSAPSGPSAAAAAAAARVVVDLEANIAPPGGTTTTATAAATGNTSHGSASFVSSRGGSSSRRSLRRPSRRSTSTEKFCNRDTLGILLGLTTAVSKYILSYCSLLHHIISCSYFPCPPTMCSMIFNIDHSSLS